MGLVFEFVDQFVKYCHPKLTILSLQIQNLSMKFTFLSWMGPFQGRGKSLVIFTIALFLAALFFISKGFFFQLCWWHKMKWTFVELIFISDPNDELKSTMWNLSALKINNYIQVQKFNCWIAIWKRFWK